MARLRVEKKPWFKRLPEDRKKVVLEKARAIRDTYQDRKADEIAFQNAINRE